MGPRAFVPAVAACLLLAGAAEAGAAWPTEGGDHGVTIPVTSLADSGPGTLRAAVMVNKARRIVFKVGGEIRLKNALVVQYPGVTIAGETAPSPGISLLGDKLRIKTHDVILRHIRVRVGELPENSDPSNRDGISIDLGAPGLKVGNIAIDHCSVAWAIDEGLSTWGAGIENVSIRRTIVAETLDNSIHEKGAHSSGLLVGKGARNILVEGNLLADNAYRNPVIDAGADAVVVNNLIYNPGFSGFHVYAKPNVGPTNAAIVGNLLIAGPDTRKRIYSFSMGINPGSKIFYADNMAIGTEAFMLTESARGSGVPFVARPPVWFDWLRPLPATEVEAAVLANVGARPDDRDATDLRIIAEVQARSGSIKDMPGDSPAQGGTAADEGKFFRPMTDSLRIVIIMSFSGFGGAQIAALRLARGLRDKGHDPRVLALYAPDHLDNPDHPYEVLVDTASPGIAGYARIALELRRYLQRTKPDVVLTFLPLANIVGQAGAFMTGVRRRIVSHRTPVNTTHPLLQRLDSLWARLGIYTGVVAVSDSVKASCAHYPRWLRKRTVVVHNGIRAWRSSGLSREDARRRFGVPDDTCLLVAVGRLAEQKNYPFMLRVLQRLDNVTLLIAGDGPLRDTLESDATALGIAGKVRMLGAVSRPDIPDLLAAADVFVQTSLFEGQSNAILEALQTGVPIVANDIPEQRETIAEPDGAAAGALVAMEDVDAWVTAIASLRDDPVRAAAARSVAGRRAHAFRYETMIAGFENALSGSGGRRN